MATATLPGDARILGLKPIYPWPLSRWTWLNEPVAVERVAALRIGLALVMLLDVFFTYYLSANDFFGPDSLGEPAFYKDRYRDGKPEGGQRWSLLRDDNTRDPASARERVKLLMGLWVAGSFLLLIGLGSRVSAVFCWAMSVSAGVSNDQIDNGGDTARTLTLFYLMMMPSGAAWSVEAWWRKHFYWTRVRGEEGEFRGVALVRREEPSTPPRYIYPWPLRLLFVQMMLIYLLNGLIKSMGDTWEKGTSLYFVLCDLTLARWSYAWWTLPFWMTKLLTQTVLWWELLVAPMMLIPWRTLANQVKRIPHAGGLHVLLRWNREIFLAFGASFHLGILLSMELGVFALYMLCLYLPLLPWERYRKAKANDATRNTEAETGKVDTMKGT